jgi:hypothetical protein
MRRKLTGLIVAAILVLFAGISVEAQGAGATAWSVAYRFVVPPNALGDQAKAGLAVFALTNFAGAPAKDVVIEVLPEANVIFGSANREQVGDVGFGAFAVLHVQLLVPNDAARFPVCISWITADGQKKSVVVDATSMEEAAK